MNAGDLILLGEAMNNAGAAEEGYARLDRFLLCMWEMGTHEYCSPTYYGVDLDDLVLIEAFAQREHGRRQARVLLEYFWNDIALNWYAPAQKLGGARSRDYDYLRGLGYLDQWMMAAGWVPQTEKQRVMTLFPTYGRWQPPAKLKRLSETRFPRLVQQIWGLDSEQSRTHYLCRDVTLSTAGACYHTMDMPLCADLPGKREGVRCFFIPDGRHDPYGKIKIQEGKAHAKTLHLKPFWTAVQRRTDALGMVVYREKDVPPETETLESHFVMPRDVDGFWIGAKRVETEAGKPIDLPLAQGEPLVLRKGSAAVGVRVVWGRTSNGQPAKARFIDDTNNFGAVRLTVTHATSKVATPNAGAAFWVRIGSDLNTDKAFETWSRNFANARAEADATGERLRVSAAGEDGPLRITVSAPFVTPTTLDPAPSRALLAHDGYDIGRKLLQDIEPIKSFRAKQRERRPVQIPAGRSICWEAETGRTVVPMSIGNDPSASGGSFVWMPAQPGERGGSSIANVTWRLNVPASAEYYLWGRVLAPTPENDSFYVRVFSASAEIMPVMAWPTRVHKTWEWTPMTLDGGKAPSTLKLPQGTVTLQLRVREAGTKIDRLFLTPNKDERPK